MRGQMSRLPTDIHPRLSLRSLPALIVAIVALVLGSAIPALAQDPTSAQYDTPVTQVAPETGGGGGDAGGSAGESDSGGAAAEDASGLQQSVGGLPFTGLDVVALLAVALALASFGFALRRMTASRLG